MLLIKVIVTSEGYPTNPANRTVTNSCREHKSSFPMVTHTQMHADVSSGDSSEIYDHSE